MGLPLISVVMVNYNHDDYLEEAVLSVINQTYQNWELILVDDGSTDRSCEIIRSFKDERIKPVFLEKNSHICIATNEGFSRVKGQYIARLDSDDVWESDKLEKQMQYFKDNQDMSICFTKLKIIDENSKTVDRHDAEDLYNLYDNRQEDRYSWLRFFFFYGNSLIQSSVLMKTEVVRKIGGFNLAYMQAHDFEFFIRAAMWYEFGFVEEALTGYRRSMNQNSSDNPENNRRFFNEYMNIRFHFFDCFSKELFRDSFGNCFINKEASTEAELLCEQAFLLKHCMQGRVSNPVLGLMKLEVLLNNEETRKVLKEKYSYTPKDFYADNMQKQFYSDEMYEKELYAAELEDTLSRKLAEKDERIRKLTHDNEKLDSQLKSILSSNSWKATKPLRSIGHMVKSHQGKDSRGK